MVSELSKIISGFSKLNHRLVILYFKNTWKGLFFCKIENDLGGGQWEVNVFDTSSIWFFSSCPSLLFIFL